jgi:hypothetical protein
MAAVKRRDGRGRCLVWDGTETLRLEGDRRQPTAGDQPYHARGQRRVAACGNPDDGERQGQIELDMRGDIGQDNKVTRWETGWLPAPAPAPLKAAASGGEGLAGAVMANQSASGRGGSRVVTCDDQSLRASQPQSRHLGPLG